MNAAQAAYLLGRGELGGGDVRSSDAIAPYLDALVAPVDTATDPDHAIVELADAMRSLAAEDSDA